MKTRRVAATLTLLTLPFGLAACGSGGGDKPSKSEVKTGIQKSVDKKLGVEGTGGAAGQTAKKVTDCVIDKTYDKLSTKALIALKDGDNDAEVESGDKSTVQKAYKECMSDVASGG